MKNARHIGFLGALAVALGIGMALANPPVEALAAPGDSDKGSSAGESSHSSSSKKDASTSSETSSETSSDDAPGRQRRPFGRPHATTEADSDDAPRRGGTNSRPEPESTSANAADDDDTEQVSIETTAAPTEFAPPAPTEPVQPAADLALMALARRESEQTLSARSAFDAPLAGQVGNTLVTDTAVEPDFVSSTRSFFGLFSLTSAGDPSDDNYVAVVFETPIFTLVLTSGSDPEDNLGLGEATIGVDGKTVFTFLSPFLNFSIGIPIEDPFAGLFIALIRAGII